MGADMHFYYRDVIVPQERAERQRQLEAYRGAWEQWIGYLPADILKRAQENLRFRLAFDGPGEPMDPAVAAEQETRRKNNLARQASYWTVPLTKTEKPRIKIPGVSEE